MEFDKKEIRNILIAAFLAAFVFSFNDWGLEKFTPTVGLRNLFLAFIFTLIIYFSHAFSQKLMANHYDYRIRFTLISMKRKIKDLRRYITFPTGPIITLLLTLLSNGKFIFLVLNSFEHVTQKEFRVGRRWSNIKEFEEAQIALAGPLSQIVLLLIFKFLLPLSAIFNTALFITSVVAVYNMLPLPKVDGLKIFFGSLPLYITSLVFVIIFILLIFHLSALQTLFLALIFSLVIGVIYLYKTTT
jgi:Zn-dependent protease